MQKLMGLGINLGNRIDLYEQDAREVKEEFFNQYKERGFENVRIPVYWGSRAGTSPPFTIDADFLDSVEQMVDWSLDRGMVTILNTHHEKWLDDESVFDAQLPRLEAIWTQLAARFASKDQKLLFEVFNEAHEMSADQLNAMNAAILPIMRASNPTRIVLIQGLKFGNPSWIISNPTALAIPDDPQIMLEIHNYDPFKYAGGKPTVHSWGSDSDRAALAKWTDDIDEWSKTNGLPIYYGEFGCTNDQTASTGRDDWFKAHYDIITAKGWGASVWSDGGGHMVYDYNHNTWVEDILRDLGRNSTSPPSPTPTPPPSPPSPSPAKGPCCYGGSTCDAMTTCHGDDKPFCASSQTNCEAHCNGHWCPSLASSIV
jgi:endoglucanase